MIIIAYYFIMLNNTTHLWFRVIINGVFLDDSNIFYLMVMMIIFAMIVLIIIILLLFLLYNRVLKFLFFLLFILLYERVIANFLLFFLKFVLRYLNFNILLNWLFLIHSCWLLHVSWRCSHLIRILVLLHTRLLWDVNHLNRYHRVWFITFFDFVMASSLLFILYFLVFRATVYKRGYILWLITHSHAFVFFLYNWEVFPSHLGLNFIVLLFIYPKIW